ncbi:MAG TPA: hypothetical protein VE783_01750 [Candidatus Limnocylindrales bacterium]|jgi:hypothetical protein|nr:hypothetical protein [Candidatus Limnocylindrales bacterium]
MLKNRLVVAAVIVAGVVAFAGTRFSSTVKAANHLSFQRVHEAPERQDKDRQNKDQQDKDFDHENEPQVEADLNEGPEIETPDVDDHEGPAMDGADHDSEPADMDDDRDDDDSAMSLKEQETIRKTFTLSAAHKTLEIDNVQGSIEVVASNSDQVQMVVNKTLRAESKERMEAAKKEVKLDITEQPDLLKLYVDGPFRCNCNNGCDGWHGDRGYSVKMDFQLQVPRNLDLKLKTVNAGKVFVRGTAGNFSVHNVNGPLEMQDVAGSGQARTVNGGVKVTFRENPKEKSDFGTINGNVELGFVRPLSADFRFKTMNGGVFSDFEMTALPSQPVSAERHNGRFVYRSDRFTGGRVGSGGPEIKAENLNGEIRILERHE